MNIEKIKKNKNYYILLLDNGDEIKTYDEVILNNNLLFNKKLDDKLIDKIIYESNYYETYYKVIKYINTKMRSTYEINKYLDKLNFSEKEKLISELKEKNLINDLLYTKAYIADQINLTNNGPRKVKNELINMLIDEKIIDSELEIFDNSLIKEKINKLINKQLKINNKSSYYVKQKILNNLINLGYDKEMILNELNNYKIDDTKSLKKDYDNLYKKLSKKYSDENLKYQIKNKLYQKGYSLDSINEII